MPRRSNASFLHSDAGIPLRRALRKVLADRRCRTVPPVRWAARRPRNSGDSRESQDCPAECAHARASFQKSNDSINNVGSQARVDFGSANHQRARRKGAEHADYRFSLEIQFFSLWRGAGEPLSFFGSVKRKRQWHCPPCRLRNTASIRRTVDWCGTWQTEHAVAFASPLRRLAVELCRELVSFDRS